ncbi:MAG: PilZ domain-containing protein [Nitrospirota bacterium]
MENRRKNMRLPINAMASIVLRDGSKSFAAYVADCSRVGIRVYCKEIITPEPVWIFIEFADINGIERTEVLEAERIWIYHWSSMYAVGFEFTAPVNSKEHPFLFEIIGFLEKSYIDTGALEYI